MPKDVLGGRYYTVPEAANQLSVSRMTILRWIKDPDHPNHRKLKAIHHPLTNHYYIEMKAVDRLAERIREKTGIRRPMSVTVAG